MIKRIFKFEACANKFVCQTSIDSTTGAATGSCVSDASCINSTSITCTRLDYANKQGPLCYVGNFGSNAQPIACAKGQVCQVITYYFINFSKLSY